MAASTTLTRAGYTRLGGRAKLRDARTRRAPLAIGLAIATAAEEFAAESERGALIQVEDTGHNIQDDQPEVVMQAITDVIADSRSN